MAVTGAGRHRVSGRAATMRGKDRRIWTVWVLVFLASWGDASWLWAGSPTERIKITVQRVIEILKEPRLLEGAKGKEKRELLRQVITPSFDFDEVAKRSLSQHWQRNAARKDLSLSPPLLASLRKLT